MSDLIRRDQAISTAVCAAIDWHKLANPQVSIAYIIGEAMRQIPAAEPEDSIPISWIEKEIDWLNNTDNCFANLTATNISAMVERWKEEKDG